VRPQLAHGVESLVAPHFVDAEQIAKVCGLAVPVGALQRGGHGSAWLSARQGREGTDAPRIKQLPSETRPDIVLPADADLCSRAVNIIKGGARAAASWPHASTQILADSDRYCRQTEAARRNFPFLGTFIPFSRNVHSRKIHLIS
jgi:hypothetical protein